MHKILFQVPTYTNWAPGEPNTVGPSYAYINLRDGLWYDEIATATGHGLCEIRTATFNKLRGAISTSIGLFLYRVKIGDSDVSDLKFVTKW